MEFESKPKFVTLDMNGTPIQQAIDKTAADEGLQAWAAAVEAGRSGAARR
ncbi:hypothetical protein ACFYR1_47090 [Streptomyces canus]